MKNSSEKKTEITEQDKPAAKCPDIKDDDHYTTINAGTSDPTDGRKEFEWQSGYASQARSEIRAELFFLLALLFLAHFLLFATWMDWISSLLNIPERKHLTFTRYSYYAFAGFLGGATFGIKYFYRTVARGYWHQDRRAWRLLSPFISTTIAIIIGAMVSANLVSLNGNFSGASYVVVGFIAGYFADQAVGKMAEVAMVIFGKSASKSTSSKKEAQEMKPTKAEPTN